MIEEKILTPKEWFDTILFDLIEWNRNNPESPIEEIWDKEDVKKYAEYYYNFKKIEAEVRDE